MVKLCSSISISGDLMTGREPHIRNELSAVVTIEHSSLEVTIWWVCYREREGREGEVYARWCVCVCVCVWKLYEWCYIVHILKYFKK